MQVLLDYPLRTGFPMVTERDVRSFWRKPIGELIGFINGAVTDTELRGFGCDWWTPWATKYAFDHAETAGPTLGDGSYGVAFHDFPTPRGSFNQFSGLVDRIRTNPHDRTHFITPWIPYRQWSGYGEGRRVAVSPCHGWLHFRVLDSRLSLHSFQRAADLLIGLPSNLVQYGALLIMVSHLTGYPADRLRVTISDAHIYEDQLGFAEILLNREPRPLPKVALNSEGRAIGNIFDFLPGHFVLSDYRPHPAVHGIPVTHPKSD